MEKLNLHKKVKSMVIELSSVCNDERDSLLKILSCHDSVEVIYLLGKPPQTDEDQVEFYTRFPKTCIFCEDPRQLAVRWTMDSIEECRMLGDQQITESRKDIARLYYHRGMQLLDVLSRLINPAEQT